MSYGWVHTKVFGVVCGACTPDPVAAPSVQPQGAAAAADACTCSTELCAVQLFWGLRLDFPLPRPVAHPLCLCRVGLSRGWSSVAGPAREHAIGVHSTTSGAAAEGHRGVLLQPFCVLWCYVGGEGGGQHWGPPLLQPPPVVYMGGMCGSRHSFG